MEKGEKVALLAIGVNLLLFGIKYFFSALSGSIALKADAFRRWTVFKPGRTPWKKPWRNWVTPRPKAIRPRSRTSRA